MGVGSIAKGRRVMILVVVWVGEPAATEEEQADGRTAQMQLCGTRTSVRARLVGIPSLA